MQAWALWLLALSVPKASAASVVTVPLTTASLALLVLELLGLLIVPCCIAIHEIMQAAHCQSFEQLVAKC